MLLYNSRTRLLTTQILPEQQKRNFSYQHKEDLTIYLIIFMHPNLCPNTVFKTGSGGNERNILIMYLKWINFGSYLIWLMTKMEYLAGI